jgi:hypothetical protein
LAPDGKDQIRRCVCRRWSFSRQDQELPTGADETLVADIYKAMARAHSHDATVHVTVPGVIEPGAELVVKNECDQPIRAVADPRERLKVRERS